MIDEAVSPGDVIDVVFAAGDMHRELIVVELLRQRQRTASPRQRRHQRERAPCPHHAHSYQPTHIGPLPTTHYTRAIC